MANRVKLTTLVDVDLKSGKVNPAALRQELPKLLEGAMAGLPGLEAVLSPDLKLGKVDVKRLQKELNDLLSSQKFDNSIGSAGFKELEQDVLRYKSALEKVANIQTNLKANKPLRENLSGLQSGDKQFSQLSAKSQKDVREFQNYLTAVTATWKEIQSGFTKTASVMHDPQVQKDLANAQRRLRTADRAVEKAKKVEAEANDKYQKAIAANQPIGKVEQELANRQGNTEKAISKQRLEQNTIKELRTALSLGSPTVGATVDPTLVKMTESMVNFNKTLNDKIKQDEKEIKRSQDEAKKQSQKQSVVKDFGKKPVSEQTHQELKDFTKALNTQKSDITRRLDQEGRTYTDSEEFKAVNKQLQINEDEVKRRAQERSEERKLLREQEAELKRSERKAQTEQDKERERIRVAEQKQSVVKDFGKKPVSEQTHQELKDFTKALNSQKSTLIANANKEGRLYKDSAQFKEINKQLDVIQREIKRRANNIKNATDEELALEKRRAELEKRNLRNAKTRPERVRRSVLIRRGAQVAEEFPNVLRTRPRDVDARVAYTETLRDSELKKATAIGKKLGTSSVEYARASKRVNKLNESLYQLGHAGKFAHPIINQLGRLLLQFARYGVGYAALYKFTNAVRALSSAVVNLEDDLKGIQAITGSTDTAMTSMAQTIKGIANTTSFGLGDIAEAVKIIAQAGVDLQKIPDTALAVANLATATGASLQTAADVITTTQSVWDELDPVTISDRVTQAANVSKLAVEDLKTIFNLGSSFFKSGNLNLDQSLGIIATLRNSGVKPSTIGTGTRQLLLELGAPDKKFSKFLANQYQSIGEDVSATEAAQRFEGFKLTDNPLVSAINELKRIGADSVSSLSALQRSIDRRALNVLTPLLRNIDQLQAQTASFSYAPTARDAAVVAMDSLKKASQNLNDGFQTLSSTVAKDALPALADLVRSVTDGVHKIDSVISDIQADGGSINGGFTLAGAVAGGIAGAKRGTGLTKVLTGATGAVVGAVGATGADIGLKKATGNTDTSETIVDLINAAGWTTLAFKTLKKIFSVKFAKATLSSGASGLKKLVAGRLVAALPAMTIPVVGQIIGGIIAAVTAAISIKDVYDSFTGSRVKRTAKSQLNSLFEKQSKELNDAEVNRQDYADILPPEAGRPIDPSTQSGAYLLNNDDLNDLRVRVSQELGVILTEDANTQVLRLLNKIRQNGTSKGAIRDQLVQDLSDSLGASDTLSEEVLQTLLIKAGKVSSSFQAQMVYLAETYDRLLNNMGELTEKESLQLKVLSNLRNSDQAYRDLLVNRSASEETILKAYQNYLGSMQAAVADKLSESDLAVKQLTELFQQYQITSEADTEALDRLSIEISKKLKQGVQDFGSKFLDFADDVISGLTKDVGKTKRVRKGRNFVNVHVPELVPDEEAQDRIRSGTADAVSQISSAQQDSNANALNQLLQELKKFQSNTVNDTTTNANREALKDTVSKAVPNLEKLAARSEELRAKFDTKGSNLTALKKEQKQLAEEIALEIDARILTRDSKGKLAAGKALSGVTIVNADADKKASADTVVKDFVGSDKYVENSREIKRLENLVDKLTREAPQKLTGSGSSNPLVRIRDKQLENLQEEIEHISKQPYDETKNKKQRLIQQKQDDQDKISADTEAKINKLQFEVQAARIRSKIKTLDEQLDQSIKLRDQASSDGDRQETTSLNGRINNILKQKEELELEALKVTKDKKDHEEEAQDIARRIKRKREEELGLRQTIKELEERIKFIKGQPGTGESTEDFFNKGVDSAQGKKSVRVESAKLSAEVLATAKAISTLQAEKSEVEKKRSAAKPGEDVSQFNREIRIADNKLKEFYESLGIASEKLAEFSPSLLKEIQKISLENIGHQIQNLPQSLKNFGSNTERRVVGAVDGFADAVAESSISLVESLFGVEEASNAASDALSGVLEAEGNKALLQQNRVLIAEEINNIRRNESDPERQEILIQQALDAQSRSEQIADAQIAEARARYSQELEASKPEGFLDKVGGIGSDLIKGVATDAIKGQVLKGFSDLFGFGGQLGSRESNPLYTYVVNGGSVEGLKEKINPKSSSTGIFSKIGNAVSGVGDFLFGGGEDTTNTTLEQQGEKMREGVSSALAEPWYEGMTGDISDSLGSFVDNLGGEFSSFTSALGVMFGVNYKAPGYQPEEWLSTAQSVVGLVGSALGAYNSVAAATGGYIRGPGTTTSDSIPAMLSDKEYVLNARATELIGKDVLDSWNFNLRSPIQRASGGEVNNLANATRSVTNALDNKLVSGQTTGHDQPSSFRVVLVDDERRVSDYLTSSSGERTLVDFVRKNGTTIKNILK